MMKDVLFALALVSVMTGCTAIENFGKDTTAPEVRLTVLNGMGRPVFSTEEGTERPLDACAYARSYPVRLAVAVSDSEGVALVSMRVFPVTVIESSIAVIPTKPDSTVSVSQENFGDKISVQIKPPPGEVQSNALVTVDLTQDTPTKVFVRAKDINGNAIDLYQVDIRPIRDQADCRDE